MIDETPPSGESKQIRTSRQQSRASRDRERDEGSESSRGGRSAESNYLHTENERLTATGGRRRRRLLLRLLLDLTLIKDLSSEQNGHEYRYRRELGRV
ncbi:hypothetical protein EVAR_23108_1 [Eumeta japonica]|uniref:Uncharacterized protein n=1 Tax=Eumeta variegata TaxID=151549 RepID=A0A4C1VN07_EUMVA|nr:hypothetical protein EVAR_23108_1 [Eumeta japonica]